MAAAALNTFGGSSVIAHGKKKDSIAQPIIKQSAAIEEEEFEEGEEYEEVEAEAEEYVEDFEDDGGEGGGISLAGTWWDKKALNIAEEISMSFGGDLKIYASKTTVNLIVCVRIEKLSSEHGSPSMTDIEAFSSAYRECLDKAERAGAIPEDLSLEVSSPGVERVARIPEELERFKDKP